MARDADQFTVEEVFNKGKLRIPDSQRKFEWGYEDAAELVDDIIASAKSSKPEDQGVYLGSIIALHNRPTKKNPSIFDIYDGQQRLTTITILFLAIRVIANREKIINLATQFIVLTFLMKIPPVQIEGGVLSHLQLSEIH